MNLILGNNSNGELVTKDVLSLSHLFVSYFTNEQVKGLFQQLAQNQQGKVLLISKENNTVVPPAPTIFSSYIYDNPEQGTIQNRSKIFAELNQSLIKRKKENGSRDLQLVLIDDIWQLIPRLNKRNGGWLKNLLLEGATFNICFVIAGTLPYHNLLVQLMQPRFKRDSPINSLGDEMIINPDDLVFFREMQQINFGTYYPTDSISSPIV